MEGIVGMMEKGVHETMISEDIDEVLKKPRLINKDPLDSKEVESYVAGYYNGNLDMYKAWFNAGERAKQIKVVDMPPMKKSTHIGRNVIGLGFIVGAAVYLYKRHKKQAIQLNDTDDEFFEDDDE
jgi:hypothetical protein